MCRHACECRHARTCSSRGTFIASRSSDRPIVRRTREAANAETQSPEVSVGHKLKNIVVRGLLTRWGSLRETGSRSCREACACGRRCCRRCPSTIHRPRAGGRGRTLCLRRWISCAAHRTRTQHTLFFGLMYPLHSMKRQMRNCVLFFVEGDDEPN